MGNLLGGAFVCWAAASGDNITDGRVAAVWLLAMFCDVLDGFVARKLGVDGPLGVQLDSLADMVTGGLAPAFVAYRLVCERRDITSPPLKGVEEYILRDCLRQLREYFGWA